ncbi:uncharacterized protein GIQ15_06727 [Arthroderma uncinatum]|uniref:uncharacterized protein n=1 Tax=Arthroderma uncinatum TaxID=74035 RepID=UPI00144AA3DC|nr:uncharacterized protein GIQ15_06727 [Arthroderma uncinatum]KAF3479751.1 hypothetical protein GIQ15_06727 [Arthroderma uncinatum]
MAEPRKPFASKARQLGFRKFPTIRYIDKPTIDWALRATTFILRHDLDASAREFIDLGIDVCHAWMNMGGELNLFFGEFLYIFVGEAIDNYFGICHPQIHQIEKIINTARNAANLMEQEKGECFGLYSMLYEYMDVFEPLSSIIECGICFSKSAYNIKQPMNPLSWRGVANAIISHNNDEKRLPSHHILHGYDQGRDAMDPKMVQKIMDWLEQVCRVAGWRVGDVSWQILNYYTYHETLCGPRMFLRTGQWQQLAAHIEDTRMRMFWMWHENEHTHLNVNLVSTYVNNILELVKNKWFIYVKPDGEFRLNSTAINLVHDIAGLGHHTQQVWDICRKVSLFDFSLLHINGPLLPPQPFGCVYYDFEILSIASE